jgi:hypothetical protein
VAGRGARPAVVAVTESLSQLQLGRAGQANRQTRSTATYPHGPRVQQPGGVHAVTAALSHMHLDTPTGADGACEQPFGTPRATAAMVPQLFDSAFDTAPVSSAAALRHRQRSLSPTASQGVTAAGSSTPERQQRQRGPSLELQQQQQQQRRGRGRLHPSGSDVAINTMPDSAGAGLGAAVGQHDRSHPPLEQDNYLRLEVGAAAHCEQCAGTCAARAQQPDVSHCADVYNPSRPLVSAMLVAACIVRKTHGLWRAAEGTCCCCQLLLVCVLCPAGS